MFSSVVEKKWIEITNQDSLDEIIGSSDQKSILFFKHSTRCSISRMALSRMNRDFSFDLSCVNYLIDVLLYRESSNNLSEITNIEHQSPQVVLLYNKKVIYSASHGEIRPKVISSEIKKRNND